MKARIFHHYFPHDWNARDDQKMVKLIKEMGWEGYGIYWAIIEKLHASNGTLLYDLDLLAFNLRFDQIKLQQILKNFKLFAFVSGHFYSRRVLKNIKAIKTKSDKAQLSAKIRWGYDIKSNDANALPTQCDSNAIKKIKETNKKTPLPPRGMAVDNPVDNSQNLTDFDKQIRNYKVVLKWSNDRIKIHFLERGVIESEIDRALGREF